MTNHWVDIKNADLIIVMGGNAAEAHPVGFRWAMEAKIHNNAKLLVIDPRFTRTASVADFYTPIRSGTDIAFLSGVLLYLISNNKLTVNMSKPIPTPACWCGKTMLSMMACSVAMTPKTVNTIKPAGTISWMKTVC